ncbi:MAG: hypothetical protein U9R75_06970 [Candidatus Thermoplasmatota archaeon]|nr:hypothetical protein [Candidatus Thermoplasmatota archaeon]
MAVPPEKWRASVCYNSASIAKKVRETLDELGWEYERDRSIHSYARLWIVISLPSVTYVFQFFIRTGNGFVINAYDERPTHAGELHFIEIKGITKKNAKDVRKFLQLFARSLPQKPYNFHWKERFRAGFLNREHIIAKRKWGQWGV